MRDWSDDYPIDKHMADLYWCQLLIWPTLMGPFHLELRFLDVWLTTSSLQVDMWTSSTNLDFGQLVQWRPLLRRVPQDLNASQLYRVSMTINLAHFEPMWNYTNLLRIFRPHIECWLYWKVAYVYFCQQTWELMLRWDRPSLKTVHICWWGFTFVKKNS